MSDRVEAITAVSVIEERLVGDEPLCPAHATGRTAWGCSRTAGHEPLHVAVAWVPGAGDPEIAAVWP